MKKLFLGIDIGTSGCKAALFDELGQVSISASSAYKVYYPAPGLAEQEPDDWWQAVVLALRKIWQHGTKPEDIAAIGIDGQSWSAIPMGKDGRVLAKTPIWMDTRAAETCREWESKLGAEHIFSVAGNPFSPTYTLPKLLHWMETAPELVGRTEHFLQSNSFIIHRLTGKATLDRSMAYGWHNFNQKTLRYDEALTKEFQIPERFLLDAVPCDEIVGFVTAEAAAQTGLSEGTPVVAGGLDAACGTLGAGVVNPGQAQEQGGQAGGMSICTNHALSHPQLILSAHVIPNRWLLQGGTVGGGASLKWLSEQLGAKKDGKTIRDGREIFEHLSDEAESSVIGANGLICLPYFAGERSPLWDEKAQGMYFGLSFSTTHADIVRATMEGVAFALLHNIETAKGAGAVISELRGVGGAANSRVWTQIKADITGLPMVITDSDIATTRGAAMLAMRAMGVFDSYEDAAEKLIQIKRRQEPVSENTVRYAAFYDVYKGLYPATKNYMAQLSNIKRSF